MTANVRIIQAEQIDSGLFVKFDDGQAAHFPATFLYSYVPWFEVDPPEGLDNGSFSTAKPISARIPGSIL